MPIPTHILLNDAQHKATSYHGLAVKYLYAGDYLLAVHAQVLSDMNAALAVVLQNNGDVTSFSDSAYTAFNTSTIQNTSPAQAVLDARGMIRLLLNENEQVMWENNLSPIDAFPAQGELMMEVAETTKQARLNNQPAMEYVQQRRGEQATFIEQAEQAHLANNPWGVIDAMYSADFAGYEAWLVQRSIQLNDDYLILCDIMWALTTSVFEGITSLPENPKEALFLTRSRLAWVVGPKEANSLAFALPTPEFIHSY